MNDDDSPNLHHLDLPSENFTLPTIHQFESLPHPHPTFHPRTQSLQRRPRGFTANVTTVSTPIAAPEAGNGGGGKGRREREKEKERTKLRERHRRAITSRMLTGLRQYGNFTLPARADMNDVLAALAREAGWTVDADGTTYRPPMPQHIPMTTFPVRSIESPISASSLRNCSAKSSLDCQPSVLEINGSLSPASLDSIVATERESRRDNYSSPRPKPISSPDCLEANQLIKDVHSAHHDGNFGGTPFVPVYVMLSRGIINTCGQLVNPEGIKLELKHLKLLNVDGVAVECWWGIVEGWCPQKYVWSGYRDLFMIIQELQLQVQVVMAFHAYSSGNSGDMLISLPQWVLEIGKENQDIFFMDREGRRNTDCLSWGIDKERVLRGRTGVEVYFDFMRSFRTEFDDMFAEGRISSVEIGLGAAGELKYPSFSESVGWRYPGIGEFQCYDRYLQQNLRKAAKLRGHSFWARGPDNAGQYNSRPHETGFFCDGGDYDSYYGRFFLRWYAQTMICHTSDVLTFASLAFEGTQIVVKIPAVYWWYKTASHAAELTAGYYNPANQDGYSTIFQVIKKHSAILKFVCPTTFNVSFAEYNEALADPEGLTWQVLNAAWDLGLTVAGQNADPCFDREDHNRMVETAKPRHDPDQHHFSFFLYQLPESLVQRTYCFSELAHFVKNMHGEAAGDQEALT